MARSPQDPEAPRRAVQRAGARVIADERRLDGVTAELDEVLAGMQTLEARKGMAEAFDASLAHLGKAAVAAARRRPRIRPPG